MAGCNKPLHQKGSSPAASEAESGQGGSGNEGVVLEKGRQDHPANERGDARNDRGPYLIDRPQPLPRERGVAPFGVGAGTDTSRRMAQEQLKER
jgi:hypothetical protein